MSKLEGFFDFVENLLAEEGTEFSPMPAEKMIKSAAAETDEVLADEIRDAAGEEIAGDDRLLIAGFDRGFDIAGIIRNARNAEQTGLFVEDVIHLVDGLMLAIAEVVHDRGIQVARTGAHHDAA
jgi:hypothetical protein